MQVYCDVLFEQTLFTINNTILYVEFDEITVTT